MNEFQKIQHSRLEFALILARESGKLRQQAGMTLSPKHHDQLVSDSDREFVRAIKIIEEVSGSVPLSSERSERLNGQEQSAKDRTLDSPHSFSLSVDAAIEAVYAETLTDSPNKNDAIVITIRKLIAALTDQQQIKIQALQDEIQSLRATLQPQLRASEPDPRDEE